MQNWFKKWGVVRMLKNITCKISVNAGYGYCRFLKYIPLSIILLSILLFLVPAAAVGECCPDDDLETDVEWVSCGSAAIAWGKIYKLEVDNVHYTVRTDDFDSGLNATAVSIEKGGTVTTEVLFLNLQPDDRWFQLDAELKVELTGITTDQYETPSAHLKFYRRGRPALEIDISASSETFEEITVSSSQYAPQKEKTITIDVKNTGEAWIENVELKVEIGELELTGDRDFEFHDQTIFKNFGCMEKDSKSSINFTVVTPAWDEVTSPYEIKYNITASADGIDIKGAEYDANASITLSCTDPKLRVVKRLIRDEIDMSPWYISGSKMYDVWDYSVVTLGVYNIGFYTVGNLSLINPPVPDAFVIAETTEDGSPVYISEGSPYTTSYKLVPARPGTYTIDRATATTNFYGKNISWESGSFSITVHGPHMILAKSVEPEDNGTGRIRLDIHNDGDRAAWINLTDTVPAGAGYIEGSIEQGTQGGTLPLSEWDLGVCSVNDSYLMTVTGVLLPPGESLGISYLIHPDRFDELDLPYAEVEFKARSNYRGVVRSSFWEEGSEVVQVKDLSTGEWITPPDNQPEENETQADEKQTQAAPDEGAVNYIISTPNAPSSNRTNQTGFMGIEIPEQFHMIDQFSTGIEERIQHASSVVETVKKSTVFVIEKALYLIIILTAVVGFLIAYLLLKGESTPP